MKVIMYNADQTRAIKKEIALVQLEGTIYRTPPKYPKPFVAVKYPETESALYLFSVWDFESREEIITRVKAHGLDTLVGFIGNAKKLCGESAYFKLTELAFVREFDPILEQEMAESRKRFAENQRVILSEKRAKQQEENAQFIREKNDEAEQAVRRCEAILRAGGTMQNQEITFYESRYSSKTEAAVIYLCRKYGVPVPARTQGWIKEKLLSVTTKDGRLECITFNKARGGKCSKAVFDCINKLLEVIRNGNCDA